MDEVEAYLSKARATTRSIYSGPVGKCVPERVNSGPRLPPRGRRPRSPVGELAQTTPPLEVHERGENRPVAMVNSFSRILNRIRLETPTVAREHLPAEAFVRATMERYTSLRERIVSMRIVVKDRHGDRSQLLTREPEVIGRQLDATRRGANGGLGNNSEFYFSFPLGKGLGSWYQYLEREGPLAGVFNPSSKDGGHSQGMPMMSMFALASDGDLNNFFNAVLNKVVRGAREGRFELKQHGQGGEGEGPGPSGGDPIGVGGLRNVAWLFADCPKWISVGDECGKWEGVPLEVQVFVRSMVPSKLCVNGSRTVSCPGYGLWLYSALVAVEMPLDPGSERILQQLYQLVCKSITTLRLQSRHESDFSAELSCLDTLLVILCRQYHLNNKDLVPL